jgi:aconitate hydratase
MQDKLGALDTIDSGLGRVSYYRLARLEEAGYGTLARLPFTVRILLENLVRRLDGVIVTEEDVLSLVRWGRDEAPRELQFLPSRVLLQDFTGIPVVVDLAALRAELARRGGDPERVNPELPVDLVIDHSVQVDAYGVPDAFHINVDREYERNRERYAFLRWAQRAFRNFRVVPPGAGIVHQVNLEYLATLVATRRENGMVVAFPDTVIGTDSHTTMINGLGVLGWGVGGIEAEAAMLNQPLPLLSPEVVGVRFTGSLQEGVTATDLVLTVTEMLRKHGVVGKFVEYCGTGLSSLALADRATIANMSPEYGATCGYFPVDAETIRYLRMTGRDPALVDLVERYYRAQGLFREDDTPEPEFTSLLELDLATVEPSLAGPRRPQDRRRLSEVPASLRESFAEQFRSNEAGKQRFDWEAGNTIGEEQATGPSTPVSREHKHVHIEINGQRVGIDHGSVVIAAITSCTNTSNAGVMMAAGLLAKKAVERGLRVKPYVKTSLAPGSRAVIDYLERAGLMTPLRSLGFELVGFGCTTCIGNSGPLPEPVAAAVDEHGLVVAAVLSGNRNFEGRIHPQVRANYLASPPLVVAYALAGTVDIDLESQPLGTDSAGRPVYLRDIWPTSHEVTDAISGHVSPDIYKETYAHIFEGEERWNSLAVPSGALWEWDEASTYLREPPFVRGVPPAPPPPADIRGARVLAVLGDSVTTDHISPAGAIGRDTPAGRYLIERGVAPREFNSYGSRRGNHEVMMRGTFANVRLRNELAPGTEGGWTRYLPAGELMSIYDAAMRYQAEGVPLLVIAGREYGSGSSRDWAAKGVALLGVKAVIAESYERIHRSNLVGMGVLPLEFTGGQGRVSLGLTGEEVYDIEGLAGGITPRMTVTVRARRPDGAVSEFAALVRIDSPLEAEQYRHGGILPLIMRRLLQDAGA